jgi:hypothetical protein
MSITKLAAIVAWAVFIVLIGLAMAYFYGVN